MTGTMGQAPWGPRQRAGEGLGQKAGTGRGLGAGDRGGFEARVGTGVGMSEAGCNRGQGEGRPLAEADPCVHCMLC